jgi:hypothetical protein
MVHLALHPTRFGFGLGLTLIALWAALWIWTLAELFTPRSAIPCGEPVPQVAQRRAMASGLKPAARPR